MRICTLLIASVASGASLAAQTAPQAAHDYVASRKPELTQQFETFLSIPNVAADPVGLKNNAEFLLGQLRQRGVVGELLTAPGLGEGVAPVVWGEIRTPGATRTVVLYAHYDGQPVTPAEWEGGKPFVPVVKTVNGEPYVYARSAGDDKAAIFAQLTALSALQAAKVPLKANIRFVWEGEEENYK